MKKYLLLVFVMCFMPLLAQGQQGQKQALTDLFKVPQHKTNYKRYLKESKNEFELTAALLFLGYKAFFSSQDMQACVFYPTCSVYAIESLRNDKFPKSVFKISDRLMRCHPLATPKHYPLHKSGQLHDPVKD